MPDHAGKDKEHRFELSARNGNCISIARRHVREEGQLLSGQKSDVEAETSGNPFQDLTSAPCTHACPTP